MSKKHPYMSMYIKKHLLRVATFSVNGKLTTKISILHKIFHCGS